MKNDRKVIEKGNKNWTPLFDRDNFIAAFEHHTHHRKFTYKLNNGTIANNGVRYIGDGSWGVPEGGCGEHRFTKHPELFEHYDTDHNPNHIWKIRIIKTAEKAHSIEYEAIGLEGNSIFNQTDHLVLP